jgi:hypothetical protein
MSSRIGGPLPNEQENGHRKGEGQGKEEQIVRQRTSKRWYHDQGWTRAMRALTGEGRRGGSLGMKSRRWDDCEQKYTGHTVQWSSDICSSLDKGGLCLNRGSGSRDRVAGPIGDA